MSRGLDHVQIDDFGWACQPDASGPDFFLYDLSWASFCQRRREGRGHPQETGIEVATLDDLRAGDGGDLRALRAPARSRSRRSTPTTARCAGRSGPTTEAARALAAVLAGGEVDEAARLCAGRLVLGARRRAGDRARPALQAPHRPLRRHRPMPIDRVRAGHLCALLARYPEARFVLMHIAYPYSDELVAHREALPERLGRSLLGVVASIPTAPPTSCAASCTPSRQQAVRLRRRHLLADGRRRLLRSRPGAGCARASRPRSPRAT